MIEDGMPCGFIGSKICCAGKLIFEHPHDDKEAWREAIEDFLREMLVIHGVAG